MAELRFGALPAVDVTPQLAYEMCFEVVQAVGVVSDSNGGEPQVPVAPGPPG
ncbi:MAG TPA: hypothetical protein VNG13_00320 [Mycobacteriales bacterium]|nr:hypothetical protein [Mycobacteriales bacterium]